ncbi:MAG: N-acetyltransferase [Bosea sp.]|uniref:GNAT family N-acetyltransferase n=1 Tax=Bosea sp. (in: a-proteobacteria) TaxID=1871050 RepID=UPI001ACBBB45|nr:GNAT family N-acetyltransferase [Bosea sp. (in: a-proteobacteria)]MBN9451740.1 N-acetyltransferase [Bosea sp. (in: a-proteobacteria)]
MDVVEKPEQNRFELTLDGGTALVAYRREGERLVLVHTEVPAQFAGQGVGSKLAKGVFELLRASRRKAVVRCEFLRGWLAKHPEYNDVVDG